MRIFSTIFLFLLIAQVGFGAVVKGTVTDAKDNSPLVGVVISYQLASGEKGGAITDIDGKYEIALKEGNHTLLFSYISYVAQEVKVEVKKGAELLQDVKLSQSVTEMKSVEIKASKITHTESAVINEIKASTAVVSGTGSSQISKTMDRNAADVVKRIPGVSIKDEKFVIIRGLPDRYNTVWLNDAGTPSAEDDRKSFSFDIIPAGLIERILVYKTPSAELPGDFAGGMVKIYTTTFQDKNQLTASFQTSSREFTTGSAFATSKTSSSDWLGYDKGIRTLPTGLNSPVHWNDANAATESKSFGNDWAIGKSTAAPDKRFSASYTGGKKLGKVRIGNTFGVTYANTSNVNNMARGSWDETGKRWDYYFNDRVSSSSVNAGVLENLGVMFGNSKIEFKNLYNQIGKNTVLERSTDVAKIDFESDPMIKGYMLSYDSRATYSSQLSGTHKTKNERTTYTWTFGYNDVFRNIPDTRRIKYARAAGDTDESHYSAAVQSVANAIDGGGRVYTQLFEKQKIFSHQFTHIFQLKDSFKITLNAGNYVEYRSRASETRNFSYIIKPGANAFNFKRLGINDIFADTNVGGAKSFLVDESTSASDKYSASNKLIASFVSLNIPVTKKLNAIAGIRHEYNEFALVGYNSTSALKPESKTNFLLPSLNISYNFNEKSLLRAAYGYTLNRPEFKEAAPFNYYDFSEIFMVKGALYPSTVNGQSGDTLAVAKIHNIDFRYEFYPRPGEMMHAGFFYKKILDPIVRTYDLQSNGDNKAVTYFNGTSAYCYGFEFDMRKNLTFLDNKLGTQFFKDLNVIANVAISKSEMLIDTNQKPGEIAKSTFQGQSPYLVNAGVYYQNDKSGIKSSLLYNVYGARLFALGNNQPNGFSMGELPFHSLDMTISKQFFKHYVLNFGIQNLLGSEIKFVDDINKDGKFDNSDKVRQSYHPGRYYTLGVKINF